MAALAVAAAIIPGVAANAPAAEAAAIWNCGTTKGGLWVDVRGSGQVLKGRTGNQLNSSKYPGPYGFSYEGKAMWDVLRANHTFTVRTGDVRTKVTTKRAADIRTIALDYPAVNIRKAANWSKYDQSVRAGVKSLRAVLTKAKNTYRCGNGQVTLVGYSQGAQVVGDTLASSLPASHRAMIGSVIMLADPKRVPKQWHNRMTPKPDNQGVRGSRKVPTAFKGRVSNFCTSDDPICSRNVSTFGTHTTYYRNSKNAWKFAAYHVCHLRTKSRCDWASS